MSPSEPGSGREDVGGWKMMEQNGPRESRDWVFPFFFIWGGQQFSLIGSQLAQFALIWYLSRVSATVLATATMIGILPGVVLGPLVGALVDRWNRRRVMIVADGVVALASAGLAYLSWRGLLHPWQVYVALLIRAVGQGFHWPAMQASTTMMVPKRHLARVGGLNQAMRGAVEVGGGPLGSLLLEILPFHWIMGIDVVTALLAILPLFFVHIPQPTGAAERRKLTLWQDVRLGWKYLWGWPGMSLLLIMSMMVNFLVIPAFYLTPTVVFQYFQGLPRHLGAMQAGWGLGVVLGGGLILGVWGGFRRRMVTILTGLVGIGLGILIIGLTPAWAFPLAVVGIFICGLMNGVAIGPVSALIQSVVPPEMQGRVFTVIMAGTLAVSPLGLAVAGPIADLFGVRFWYVASGILCTAIGLGGFFVRPILHLEDRGAAASPQAQMLPAGADPEEREGG
jgi:DHA3 family macrolide efflux protein-like MFS transporter